MNATSASQTATKMPIARTCLAPLCANAVRATQAVESGAAAVRLHAAVASF